MKQNMRKVWIALCMMVCLFALVGCSEQETVTTDPSIDPQTVEAVQAQASMYVDSFSSLTDAELYEQLLYAEENGATALEAASLSWLRAKGELGAYVSQKPAAVIKGYESYIAVVIATFETRDVKMTLQVNKDLTETMSLTFVPQYLTSEKMAKVGLDGTILYITLATAAVLLIGLALAVSGVNALKKALLNGEIPAAAPAAASQAAAPAPAEKPAAAPTPAAPALAPAAPVEENLVNDAELVAVIAAAIAASEGKTSTNGLVVRSIKRVPNRNWK